MPGQWHTCNSYGIRVPDRDGLVEHLRECGVGTNVYYPKPLHLNKVFEHLGYGAGRMPVAESVCRMICAIPLYPEITDEEQQYVVDRVMEFLTRA